MRNPVPGVARWYGISGQFGTGANMSFRREVFERVGLFDPALDVGTASNGGGDLKMYFRLLKGGYTLVYRAAGARLASTPQRL